MKSSLKRYLEYLDSDEEFILKTRITRMWNDNDYILFREIIDNVIKDYKGEALFPISIVYLFISGIDHLINLISNPSFYSGTDDDYRLLIQKRIIELNNLKKSFMSGELLYID